MHIESIKLADPPHQIPSRQDYPFVVLIFVVVTSHLLLIGASQVTVHMGMQQGSAPTHVLRRNLRVKGDIFTAHLVDCVRNRHLLGSPGTGSSSAHHLDRND